MYKDNDVLLATAVVFGLATIICVAIAITSLFSVILAGGM